MKHFFFLILYFTPSCVYKESESRRARGEAEQEDQSHPSYTTLPHRQTLFKSSFYCFHFTLVLCSTFNQIQKYKNKDIVRVVVIHNAINK